MAEPVLLDNWRPMNQEAALLHEYKEMDLNEIFNGSDDHKGLIPLMNDYIDSLKFSEQDSFFYKTMLDFLGNRASGQIKTGACFL